MKIPNILFVSCALLSLAMLQACTGKSVVLKNAAGKTAKCEVSTESAVMTGVLIRDHTIDKCVKHYEAQGYKKVSERRP